MLIWPGYPRDFKNNPVISVARNINTKGIQAPRMLVNITKLFSILIVTRHTSR